MVVLITLFIWIIGIVLSYVILNCICPRLDEIIELIKQEKTDRIIALMKNTDSCEG